MIKKVINGKNKGKWVVRVQPIDHVTGKRISLPLKYVDTKTEAKRQEEQIWKEYKAGLNLGDGKAVFAESFQKYVNQRASSISPVTLKSWQESANSFKNYFGKTKINQVTTALVSKYAHDYVNKNHVTVSKSSIISKRLIHMRNFFKSLEGKAIKENPVPDRALKSFFKQSDFSLPQEWYIFSDSELESIRNLLINDLKQTSVNNWGSKLAILIESYTGMRVGELQALRFSNLIEDNNGYWSFRINNSWSDYTNNFTGALKARAKGYSRTLLPLPSKIVDLVKEFQTKQGEFLRQNDLINKEDLLFINLHDYKQFKNNKPISQHAFNLMLKNICAKLEIEPKDKKLSVYAFRHTICTNLASTPGMSYPWAAEKMGHSLQMFMNTYVGLNSSIEQKMTKLWAN